MKYDEITSEIYAIRTFIQHSRKLFIHTVNYVVHSYCQPFFFVLLSLCSYSLRVNDIENDLNYSN